MSGRVRWIAFAALLCVLFVGPLVVLALRASAARWAYPAVLPHQLSTRGVEFVIANAPDLSRALASSTGYALLVVGLSIVLTLPPAWALARFEFRGRLVLEALLLSPVLVPSIAYAMGVHFLFIRAGIANTTLGAVVILTAAGYPYMLRALIAGYQQIDPNYEVCAVNLGAARMRRVVFVHLPLLGPAIATGGSVVFLTAFSDYFLVFLIGGGAVRSYTGYLFPFLSGGDHTLSATLTLLFLVVPLVLFWGIESNLKAYYRRRGMHGPA